MVNKGSESYIQKRIKQTLPLYCPNVVWVDRLQSGRVQHRGRWIQMCQPGTPDLYALVNVKGGHTVFIECKTAKGRQTPDQRRFEALIGSQGHLHYILARDVNTVVNYINNL